MAQTQIFLSKSELLVWQQKFFPAIDLESVLQQLSFEQAQLLIYPADCEETDMTVDPFKYQY